MGVSVWKQDEWNRSWLAVVCCQAVIVKCIVPNCICPAAPLSLFACTHTAVQRGRTVLHICEAYSLYTCVAFGPVELAMPAARSSYAQFCCRWCSVTHLNVCVSWSGLTCLPLSTSAFSTCRGLGARWATWRPQGLGCFAVGPPVVPCWLAGEVYGQDTWGVWAMPVSVRGQHPNSRPHKAAGKCRGPVVLLQPGVPVCCLWLQRSTCVGHCQEQFSGMCAGSGRFCGVLVRSSFVGRRRSTRGGFRLVDM